MNYRAIKISFSISTILTWFCIKRCNLCCVECSVMNKLFHSSLSRVSEYFSLKHARKLSFYGIKKKIFLNIFFKSPFFLLTNINSTGASVGVSCSWRVDYSQSNLPLSVKLKHVLQKEISCAFLSAERKLIKMFLIWFSVIHFKNELTLTEVTSL